MLNEGSITIRGGFLRSLEAKFGERGTGSHLNS